MPYLTENRELLEAFRAGEREALDRVYRHYVPAVAQMLRHGFSFQSRGESCAFRGFASDFDLENAVQEVFVRAFGERARLQYDGLRPYVNYVFAIARNLVIDQFRRQQSQDRFVRETAAEAWVVEAPVGPSRVEEKEISALIREFLTAQAPLRRQLYRLRFVEQLSQRQTAARLSLSRIQVRRHEAHLKRELLEYLREGGYLDAFEPGRLPTLALLVGLLPIAGWLTRGLP